MAQCTIKGGSRESGPLLLLLETPTLQKKGWGIYLHPPFRNHGPAPEDVGNTTESTTGNHLVGQSENWCLRLEREGDHVNCASRFKTVISQLIHKISRHVIHQKIAHFQAF